MFKQKSFWAGLIGVISGVGMVITGDTNTGIQTIITGVSVIFLRQAIAK